MRFLELVDGASFILFLDELLVFDNIGLNSVQDLGDLHAFDPGGG